MTDNIKGQTERYTVRRELFEGVSDRLDKPSPSSRFTTGQRLQVLNTFIAFFNTLGFLLTFGVFQTYYEQVLLRSHSSSAISWISTVCAFIILSSGLIAGPLYDRGYFRSLLIGGSSLQIFGLMVMSLCSKYYQFFLAQGLAVGIGAGMVFTPSVAAAGASFPDTKTRSKVMGLLACGSSIAGIVYPIVFQSLVVRIGFPWTVRTIAFMAMALYCLSFLVFLDPPKKSTTKRRAYDRTAFTDAPFMLLCIGTVLCGMAYYVPLLYLPSLTQLRIPSIAPDFVFDLLAVLNGGSAIGRLMGGWIAAWIGPLEASFGAYLIGSFLLFCWIAVSTVAGTITWAIFWGGVSGIFVAIGGAFLPLVTPDISLLGTRSGMYWASFGFGTLIGGPIGGAVFDRSATRSASWQLNVFAACFMFVGSLLFIPPTLQVRRHRRREEEEEEIEMAAT